MQEMNTVEPCLKQINEMKYVVNRGFYFDAMRCFATL